MKNVAFFAHLDNTAGIALRSSDGTVSFKSETTGLWTQLFDADAPRLMLHGRMDIADAQMLADGNRVAKTSRTLRAA